MSMRSLPRYNLKISEINVWNVIYQIRYTLYWCQGAQVNDYTCLICVSFHNYFFFGAKRNVYFLMMLSLRHYKYMHLWKCILYFRPDLWIEVALQRKDAETVFAVFLLLSPFFEYVQTPPFYANRHNHFVL